MLDVVRLGADIGLVCTGCGHRVLLERAALERRLVAFVHRGPDRGPEAEPEPETPSVVSSRAPASPASPVDGEPAA
jgi:hypothetical protein